MACLAGHTRQRKAFSPGESARAFLLPYPAESFSRPVSLTFGKTLIGRDATNHVQLAQGTISRNHAVIRSNKGTYVLIDLSSRNGTYVNGQRVTEKTLHHQDKIAFGNRAFLFLMASNPAAEASTDMLPVESESLIISENEFDPSDLLAQMADTAIMDAFKLPEASHEDSREPNRRAHQRLLLLYQLSEKLRSAQTREDILDWGLEHLLKAIPTAERSLIMMRSAASGALEVKAVKYADHGQAPEPIPVSRTILDWALTARVALVSQNVLDDQRFENSDSIMIQGLQTMICVPIMSQDKVDGIVYIDSGQLFNPMTQEDMTFTAAVANEMALSMENLRLQRESLRNERMAAIGMTITNIAHNIRNLINLNFNAVDLMGIHLDKIDDEKIHKNWGLVRRGFERITNLSADMLDFAKDITMELKPVNINRVVLDNQDIFEQSLVSRNIEIALQLAPDNPTWMMDETQFQRALHNLIVNAIDAVRENETGRIRISTAVDENQCLRVSVTDNGGGIDPQHQEKIFDLFYTTKGTGGSGLGLPMVKKFIEKMDGELLLESNLDTGTTFAMVFPPK